VGTHTEPGSGTGTGRTRPRRRDRRGRGLRGPLAPASVPLARSRAERFDELVSEAVQRLERRWSTQLEEVEFAVADVPPPDSESWSAEPVPLARLIAASSATPPRIVVYRRPLEARASDRTELGALIHEVLVEEVATLLGIEPENVDPRDDDGEE
jgi:predicted Zn-dependent protease with MMP-like domain